MNGHTHMHAKKNNEFDYTTKTTLSQNTAEKNYLSLSLSLSFSIRSWFFRIERTNRELKKNEAEKTAIKWTTTHTHNERPERLHKSSQKKVGKFFSSCHWQRWLLMLCYWIDWTIFQNSIAALSIDRNKYNYYSERAI